MDWRRASEDERAVENVRRWLRDLPTLEEEEEAARKADEEKQQAARRAETEAMDRWARAAADAIRRDAGFVPMAQDVVRFDSDPALLRRLHSAGRHATCLECGASLYTPQCGPIPRSFWCRECHQRFEQKRTAADDILKDYYGRKLESAAPEN